MVLRYHLLQFPIILRAHLRQPLGLTLHNITDTKQPPLRSSLRPQEKTLTSRRHLICLQMVPTTESRLAYTADIPTVPQERLSMYRRLLYLLYLSSHDSHSSELYQNQSYRLMKKVEVRPAIRPDYQSAPYLKKTTSCDLPSRQGVSQDIEPDPSSVNQLFRLLDRVVAGGM